MNNKKVIVFGMDSVSMRLIKRFAAEGHLKNIKKLMDEGAAQDAMPTIPAYTPTNWATIATGAYPGTHGAANWNDKSPVDKEDRRPISTFDSRTITAETIWEAAEKAGKRCLVVAYPGSHPSRLKDGFIVVPLHRGLTSLMMLPGQEYSTQQKVRAELVNLKPASGWQNLEDKGMDICLSSLETEIVVARGAEVSASASSAEAAKRVGDVEDGADVDAATVVEKETEREVTIGDVAFNVLVLDSQGRGYDRVLLTEGKDAAKPIADLKLSDWSPWLIRNIPTQDGIQQGSMRFKLLDLSPDGELLRLVRSEVYPTTGFTYPESLSEELLQNVGPYIEHAALAGGHDFDDYERCVYEEIDYQVEWHIKTAKYLMEKYGWDLYYCHWHFTDSIEHHFLHPADPASPAYNPEIAEQCLNVLRRGFALGDKLVGGLMEIADENTYVIVVSDHGNSSNMFTCSLPRFLEENGFTVFGRDKGGVQTTTPRGIDWSKTKAYPLGGLQLCVNLKGREPYGVVEPGDYEKVQEELIDALYNWKDPMTGKRAVALALKKRDAQLIGYWGDRVGDVIFVYNAGFAWGEPGGDATIAQARGGANHGPQIPTAETPFSSNLAVFIIAGPGIKRGYERDFNQLGYVRLIDLVPTVCHLMGIQPPAHSQGTVLYDLLE